MLQQINLYEHLTKTAKSKFRLDIILIVYVLYFVFLLFNLIYDYTKKNEYEKKVAELTIELDKEKAYLSQIKEQYPSIDLDNLEGSMQRLQQELASKGEVINLLSNKPKFSDYFTMLSQTIVPGVWLTEFKILQDGKSITLKGITKKPALAHQYLQQLRKQNMLRNMNLELKEVSQVADEKTKVSYLNFSIMGTVGSVV